MEVIWDRQFGFLKETLVAPMSRFQIMIGRTLGGATVATMQAVIFFVISLLAGFRPESWAMAVPALLVMFLIALVFTALGMMIGSLLSDIQGFQLIINFLIMPLFFLSGALFPLQGLPKTVAILAALDPLSYGVDALRALLIGTSHYGLPLDLAVLSGVTVIFIGIGSYLFSRVQV